MRVSSSQDDPIHFGRQGEAPEEESVTGPAFAQEDRPPISTGLDSLSFPALDGEASGFDPPAVGVERASPPPRQEDLSDLLEEIPEDSPEEVLEALEGLPEASTIPDSIPPPVPGQGQNPFAPRPAGLRVGARGEGTEHAESSAPPTELITADPLGILSTQSGESHSPPAIQVGAVTPGKQHQVTVPLEMSVEGRKVRLHLRMTLTLSR